jgi:hypothetical protein
MIVRERMLSKNECFLLFTLAHLSISYIMMLKLAHINSDTTALYNVVDTRNFFWYLLVHAMLFDNFKYSRSHKSFLQFHGSIEEAVVAARRFQKEVGGQIAENGNCTIPRLRPKSSEAFINASMSK